MKTSQKFLTVLIMIMAFVPGIHAQLTAEQAFADAPSSIFPLLDKNARLDMIDYFKSGSSTPSQNAFQGTSRITALSPAQVSVAMTDATKYDIIVLPQGGAQIIALIQTVATPAPDSHITFYNSSWSQLKETLFTPPTMQDWLTAKGAKDSSQVSNLVPFMLASYSYDPATSVLTLTNNLKAFLSADIYSMISSDLLPSLTYKWNGKVMQPVK